LATVQIPRDGFAPLVLRELMAVALTLGAATSDMALADVAALANVRFAPGAAIPLRPSFGPGTNSVAAPKSSAYRGEPEVINAH
jgi:hypothetical protein